MVADARAGEAPSSGRRRWLTPPRLRLPKLLPKSWPRLLPLLGQQSMLLRAALAAAFENRRGFLLLPFLVIAGILLYLQLAVELPAWLGPAGAVSLVVLAIALRARIWPLRVLFGLGAIWLGLWLLPLHAALLGTPMLAYPTHGQYQFRIDQTLRTDPDGIRVLVSEIVPLEGTRALPVRRARLVLPVETVTAPGDVLSARIRFYPVPRPVLPGGFDTQFHAFFDGIGAYGSALGETRLVAAGDPYQIARVIDGVRNGIADRIDAALPQPAAGIARALITGDQSQVPEEARDTMANAGLAHVLSVSGLHLTLVAGLVLTTLRGLLAPVAALHRFVPVKRLAALGAITAALAYFAISGGSIAAQRATVMLLLVLGAMLFGRRALTMRNVAIAALVILCTDPAGIFRPSFQLSFAAVVALIGAWELSRPNSDRDVSPAMRLFSYFGGIALTSLVAGLATLLFSIYHFQQTSPLGVLGNLLSLPLVGFVMMPSGLAATLLMPFGLEQPFLWAMGRAIDQMLALGSLVSSWSEGIDQSPLLLPAALGLGLAALAWFTFVEGWYRLLGPILLLPAVVLFGLDRAPDVLISDTTHAVAVRGSAGLELVAGRGDSFAVDVWRETYSEPLEQGGLSCDSVGCIGSSARGFTVAIAADPAAFHEDCALVDLMLARRPAPASCDSPLVIDSRSLERRGTHALYWDAAARRFTARATLEETPRPWRPFGR